MAGRASGRLGASLDRILTSPVRLRVAKFMVRLPEKEFTGREVAALLDLSHTAVQDAMRILVANGLVTRRVIGRAHVFRTNKESYLYGVVRELVKAEEGLEEELFLLLRSRLQDLAISLVVYGSHARGTASSTSDLDVIVVTEKPDQAQQRLSELQMTLLRRYGIYLDVKVWTPPQIRSRKSLSYVRAARSEGVTILGKPLEEVIRPG